ncbi:MAG: HAD family hydrolase [Halobaculum sp.]
MRLVIDYGGVIVHHGEFREQATVLGVENERDRRFVALAYVAFREGFVRSTAAYLDLLSTLTGASEAACRAYLDERWLDPEFPAANADTLRELASDHTLVCLSNGVRPWIETVLADHGVRDCFDRLVVSSDLRRSKPHPRGYLECLPEADEPTAMVSDEYDEDLLMAETLGMASVWVEGDETPYREPDARISTLADLPALLDDGFPDR